MCFCAMPFGGLSATVDAQCDAGGDMAEDWDEDEEGFEREGLIVGSCEQ